MSCCGVKLEARRNADKRVTYTPSSRRFSFSGLSPVFTVRRGDAVLLTVSGSPLSNGSVFQIVGDSMVLTLEKADLVVLDSVTPDTEQEVLSYDVVATDQAGFENWILGGPFILLGINDQSCGDCDSDVEVSLGGQCVDITIEGGNLAVGSSVALSELTAAVTQASDSAEEAAASAVQAEAAAATAVGAMANKANTDASNLTTSFINAAPYAQLIGPSPATRSVQSRLAEKISVNDYLDGATPGTRFNRAGVASGGSRQRAVYVPPGTYQVDSAPIVSNVTHILDGVTTFTGTQADTVMTTGKIIQFSGLPRDFIPGQSDINFTDPFYVGPIKRPGLIDYATRANRGAYYTSTATIMGYSTAGLNAICGVTDSGVGNQLTHSEGGIALMGLAINRTAITPEGDPRGKTTYAMYLEGIRYENAGISHCVELDSINYGNTVNVIPSQPFGVGLTSGLWLMSGGGPSTGAASPSSVAVFIGNNGSPWRRGIVFHNLGVEDQGGGNREAIAFGLNMFMAAYNNTHQITSRIQFDGVTQTLGARLVFDDGGVALWNHDKSTRNMLVTNTGFVFGPSASTWMEYAAGSSVFRVGPAAAPIIRSTATAVTLFADVSIGQSSSALSLRIQPVGSAVNYTSIRGAVTGGAPIIEAMGSDTNIDLLLQSKGTGRVRFGTHTANADAPVTGYITIKDASGTERKLAVIA